MAEVHEAELQDYVRYFTDEHYLIRKKVFKLFGGAFHVFNDAGEVVLYSKMKAFKLKEDIRLYTGEDMQKELLRISARNVIDFGATYDVIDSGTEMKVGALRRKGLKSMLKDEWLILDENDNEVGMIEEESTVKAIARRINGLATMLLPQSFLVELGGAQVCEFKQNFNPFVQKIDVDFGYDQEFKLDRRLGMAAAILMAAIEGRQQS